MKELCEVLPTEFGSPEWNESTARVMGVAQKRRPDDPQGWATDWLRDHYDRADLRALGYCRDCGQRITLRQTGNCVYSEPCGHYRAQGDLRKMQPFLERRASTLSPERREALLRLIHASTERDKSQDKS